MDAPQGPPPDPEAEQLMAVIGVDRLLDPKARIKVTQEMRDRAARIPAMVADEVRRFLSASDFEKDRPMPAFQYHRALEQLTGLDTEARIAALAETLEDSEHGCIVVAGNIFQALKVTLPVRSRQTVTGPVSVTPNDFTLYRFRVVYAVAADPMDAMRDLREGILSRGTARALKIMFPTLYEAAVQASLVSLARLKGDRPSLEVGRAKTLMLEALWLSRSYTPELGREMQKHFETKGADEPGMQPQRSLGDKSSDLEGQTAIQRVSTS